MYPYDSETSGVHHDCDALRTILCAGSFIIAIGSYDPVEDCFVVRELRQPPLTPSWHAELLPPEELKHSSRNDNAVHGQSAEPDHATLTPSPERSAQSPGSRLHQQSSAERQTSIEAETASEDTRDNIDGTLVPDRGIETDAAHDKISANMSVSMDTADESVHVLIAGDLALDDAASYAKWRKLLRTIYAPSQSAVEPTMSATVSAEERVKSCPCPAPISPRCIFVLCGPFLRPRSHSWPPSTEEHAQGAWGASTDADVRWCTPDEKALLKAFRRFGKLLAAFRTPLRASGSEFVLVPAERDLECFGDVLPRPPLASICVDALREHSGLGAEQIRAEMDPTRFQLQFEDQNPYSMFVHATETLSERLAADSLPWPPNCHQCQSAKSMQAFAGAVFRTILHQRHIAPFQCISNRSFGRWTVSVCGPRQSVIVLTILPLSPIPPCRCTFSPYAIGGSATLSGGLAPSRALCVAPGSFGRDSTMVWVQVSSQGQRPPLAWPLHLLAEEPSETHGI
ncbi:hypothetical protein F1559_001210 [Cyanidiococcus yangmingshanensis]|uniref:DNA polymerase II subunit 2 n=1 Tax=Cyanidiococcus yangmingshanensis TaxID=2690220 RepID=A0A7J7IEK4_9RHOD|nr:hypothetical protein F1559_001210 [Cyanidiococcus yangmingshanensis]